MLSSSPVSRALVVSNGTLEPTSALSWIFMLVSIQQTWLFHCWLTLEWLFILAPFNIFCHSSHCSHYSVILTFASSKGRYRHKDRNIKMKHFFTRSPLYGLLLHKESFLKGILASRQFVSILNQPENQSQHPDQEWEKGLSYQGLCLKPVWPKALNSYIIRLLFSKVVLLGVRNSLCEYNIVMTNRNEEKAISF